MANLPCRFPIAGKGATYVSYQLLAFSYLVPAVTGLPEMVTNPFNVVLMTSVIGGYLKMTLMLFKGILPSQLTACNCCFLADFCSLTGKNIVASFFSLCTRV